MEKLIGFVGYECEDIAIYMAKVLRMLGNNIAIVDRTEQELVCEIFDLQSESGTSWKEGEYCGIHITNKGVCREDYDYIFYLFQQN